MVQLDSRYIDEQEVVFSVFPVGTVLIYDQDDWVNDSTLPGWFACDGTCGTPNLVDKHIRGACNVSECIGVTGGSQTVTMQSCHLPSHSHTNPDHSHTICDHVHAMGSHNHSSGSCAPGAGYGSNISSCFLGAGGGLSCYSIAVGYASGSYADYSNAAWGGACHCHLVNSHGHSVCCTDMGNSCNTGGGTDSVSVGTTGEIGGACAIDIQPRYRSAVLIKRMN